MSDVPPASEAILYPRREFHAEARTVQTTGGFGGQLPRLFTQLKYTMPGITGMPTRDLRYDVRTALVIQGATARNDLTSLGHYATIKGIGAPTGKLRKPEKGGVREATELLFNQIG